MLNYAAPVELLQPLLPRGTELDLWQGKALVSMVGFLFLKTKVLGVPVPFHRDFEEINLRFYVRRETPQGVRRGVVFIKELVPRFAIAAIARLLYNENYEAVPMRHRVLLKEGQGGSAEYRWRSGGKWNRLAADFAGVPVEMEPGSEAEFIFEHYWGYTRQRDGGTAEYEVRHPRWRAWRATRAVLECDIPLLYGEAFTPVLAAKPLSAYVAEGSKIQVFGGARLT